MKKYGYIRVSTKEQNPERQFIALKEQGISEENIYLDRISGKDFQRPQYQKLLAGLKRGDALIIKSIDRLGRNYGEILEQWRIVTKEIGGGYSGGRHAIAEYKFLPWRFNRHFYL